MFRQTVIAVVLFELYFIAVAKLGDAPMDGVMFMANLMFALWLAMEAMRVRLGHFGYNNRTYGFFSRLFLIISFASVALAFADRAADFPGGARASVLPSAAVYLGVASFIVGVLLRHVSIKTLGRFFVTKVQITDDHELIRDGIYRTLRHPSYTGLIFGFAGVVLMLQSTAALVLFLLAGLPAYLYRIRIEESALVEQFGQDYAEYRRETYALIPYLY